MGNNELSEEKISKLFLKFCIPAVIAMVISGAQMIIDGIFVGNFVGENALASVNIVMPFMQLIIGLSMIMSIGSLSYMSRVFGAGLNKKGQDAFKTSWYVLLLLMSGILIFGVTNNELIASALGATELLLPYVSSYIYVISFFAPVMATMFIFGFSCRVIGQPDRYLKATIASIIINITLDFVLIGIYGYGIKGAAFATGMAYLGGMVIVVFPMLNKNNLINIFNGDFDRKIILPIAYNGSSEGVISIATAITAYVFNISLLSIVGEAGVAAFTTINYIGQMGILIMFGISDGITPIVAYNYGKGYHSRVKSTLSLAIKSNVLIGIVLFCLMFFLGEQLISLFIEDNIELVQFASNGAKIYAFSFFICGYNIISSGYFTAIGFAKESILIAACKGIVFIVIGIVVLPKIFGINGIWLTIPFAELITFFIAMRLKARNNDIIVEKSMNN